MSISRVNTKPTVANESELLTEVFNAVTSAIIVIDKHGRIVNSNKCAQEMLGTELIGKLWISVVRNNFALSADDGHEVSLNDGRKLLVDTKPLSVGQLVTLTDVTTTRRLQERIGHMERLSSLGKMAASLAHQIRTPLSAAMLYAANLGNRSLSEVAKSSFIRKLMDRLQDLENQVRDILLFARSSENIVDTIDVCDLIDSIERSSEGVLTRNDAHLSVRTNTSPINIIANKTALSSAITNLINNAIEAGAKHVYLNVEKQAEVVELKIADNGKGMPKELLQRVFEPFYTTKSNGTGLGLAVVQSVVKAHQGAISVVSEMGKGTCFTITIPLAKTQENELSKDEDSAIRSKTESENAKAA